MLQILVSVKKLDVTCHIFLCKGIVLEVIVLQDYIFVARYQRIPVCLGSSAIRLLEGLYQFTIHDQTIHDTTIHDLCIN